MSQAALSQQVAASTAYEDLFVPALFRQWTRHVADAAAITPGDRVLDVACGTGVLARAVAARLGNEGAVTGLDPSPGMLEVARRQGPGIDWRQGTAEDLPFEDASFDAVVSQFGLMFFADRRRGIREMQRVLKPGGRYAIAVWDALGQNSAYQDEVQLAARIAGPAAAEALSAPFALGDARGLAALFEEAGAAGAAVRTHKGLADFPSLRTMLEADLLGWLPMVGVRLPHEIAQQLLAEGDKALARYVRPEGRFVFPVSAHVVSGRRPDP